MADSNSGSGSDDKTQGQYSDSLLRLVEETDKDGAISYCVECCKTGDLLYSSTSKPQAYSYCEGYRARDANDMEDNAPKADDKGKAKAGDDKTAKVEPAKTQRKRMLI
jgi:hypothetical protein